MHPAFSVIFFTTISGAGYGLLVMLSLAALLGFDHEATTFWGLLIAVVLISAGLLSSTLHLGHPERAWRAFSQWRSSWLSREGVLAVFTYLPVAYLGWHVFIAGTESEQENAAWAFSAVLSLATVYSTGMIYRTLRSIRQWYQPLVVPLYLCFGLTSGLVIYVVLDQLIGHATTTLTGLCAAAIVFTWATKRVYWQSADRSVSASTLNTATGLSGDIRVFDPPHTEDNYLLRELGFEIGRKHRVKLRAIAQIAGVPLSLAFLAVLAFTSGIVSVLGGLLLLSACATSLVIERWLFFAEAEHTAMLYYRGTPGNS